MIPGYRAFPCFNMVQFEGICLIHLPDLLFDNLPDLLSDNFCVFEKSSGNPVMTPGVSNSVEEL